MEKQTRGQTHTHFPTRSVLHTEAITCILPHLNSNIAPLLRRSIYVHAGAFETGEGKCTQICLQLLTRNNPFPQPKFSQLQQLGLHSIDHSQSYSYWAGAHICTFMFMHGARWWPPATLCARKPRFHHACNDNLEACLVTGKVEAEDKSLTYAHCM